MNVYLRRKEEEKKETDREVRVLYLDASFCQLAGWQLADSFASRQQPSRYQGLFIISDCSQLIGNGHSFSDMHSIVLVVVRGSCRRG